jgi:hypothetical protein
MKRMHKVSFSHQTENECGSQIPLNSSYILQMDFLDLSVKFEWPFSNCMTSCIFAVTIPAKS